MLMYPLHAGLKKLWSSSRMARNRRKTKRKKKVVVIMIYDPQFSSGVPLIGFCLPEELWVSSFLP